MGKKLTDLTGQTFGNWVVVRYEKNGHGQWLCQCLVCGAERARSRTKIGRQCSACMGRIDRSAHGGRKDRRYAVWARMIQRCTNPNYKYYRDYGGRGITVCERWRLSFAAFRADVGESPTAAHSIDRIDNSKGYEPGNVRWATSFEQHRNQRSNIFLEYDGRRMCAADWARLIGIGRNVIYQRVRKGWPIERVLSADRQRLPKKEDNAPCS